MLGAALPLALNAVIDLFSKTDSAERGENAIVSGFASMNKMEKLVFCVGIVITPAIALLPRTSPQLGLAFTCASRAQLVLVGGSIMITSSRGNRKIFPLPATLLVIVLLSIANGMQAWAINKSSLTYVDASFVPVDAARQVSTWANWLAAFVFIGCALRWIYTEFICGFLWSNLNHYRRGTYNRVWSDMEKHQESVIWFPMLYVVASLVVIGCVGDSSLSGDFYMLGDRDLLFLNVPFFFFEICVIVLSMQLVKFESVESLYKLLDSKKTYVRYM
jgi:hypothetical protein